MADDDIEYALVMPFVVCQSHGGPYEDQAFVAGYQAGQIDRALRAAAAIGATQLRATVYAALVPQLELIGMNHGFPSMTAENSDGTPEWSLVTFADRAEPEGAQP